MEIALDDLELEDDDKYFTAHIIKYTLIVAALPPNVKKRLTSHNNFSRNFFNDLKKSKYTKELFGKFQPNNTSLEKKFKDIKYEILEYTDEFKKQDKFKEIIDFLEMDTTIRKLIFR